MAVLDRVAGIYILVTWAPSDRVKIEGHPTGALEQCGFLRAQADRDEDPGPDR